MLYKALKNSQQAKLIMVVKEKYVMKCNLRDVSLHHW